MSLFKHTGSGKGTAARTAEKRMRQWTLGLEVQSRKLQEGSTAQLHHEMHPSITISRETGAGAAVIARRVGLHSKGPPHPGSNPEKDLRVVPFQYHVSDVGHDL